MRDLPTLAVAVACLAIGLVAGVVATAAARPLGARPEPMAVHAMRLQHPALVRGLSTAAVGDKAAETLADIRTAMPAQQMVNRARVRWGTTSQDEALQVVLTLWSGFAADAPAPNGDGAVEPAP